ncbi:hypothetical protein GCM10011315_28980 [Roseovarius pacificus]|nr:hypothetical protein GCM10011315_28980 [Roseovarius pacificus]
MVKSVSFGRPRRGGLWYGAVWRGSCQVVRRIGGRKSQPGIAPGSVFAAAQHTNPRAKRNLV